MKLKILILLLLLNYLKSFECLVCSYCNGCSFNTPDTSQKCSEPYEKCFSGKRNGLIYQGCTTFFLNQLQSTYTNVEVCATNFCNKNVQINNRYAKTCYNCMGCPISNANKFTQICQDSSYYCFSGSQSGMVYQGCTNLNNQQLSSMYTNLRTCTNDLCNNYQASNYAGLSCYSCEGCTMNFASNNIPQQCPDNSYNCYVGTAVGLVYQGCTREPYSSLSTRFKQLQICTGNLCNSNKLISMGLTCYVCQGCRSNDANIRSEQCADSSFKCFSGIKLGLIYQGCTQWSDSTLKSSYNRLNACTQNYCNSFSFVINNSVIMKFNIYFCYLLIVLKAFCYLD
ncbi:unnamed protein product [Brachionus calyciflorus]|uniref:Transmembrane protein n=1 Tax=Brachionus calyciflorus TaxID=104777 RepID=A0A814KL25_9BILA|nr:unnamed protein product [Brachionus calyciflorus]